MLFRGNAMSELYGGDERKRAAWHDYWERAAESDRISFTDALYNAWLDGWDAGKKAAQSESRRGG